MPSSSIGYARTQDRRVPSSKGGASLLLLCIDELGALEEEEEKERHERKDSMVDGMCSRSYTSSSMGSRGAAATMACSLQHDRDDVVSPVLRIRLSFHWMHVSCLRVLPNLFQSRRLHYTVPPCDLPRAALTSHNTQERLSL